MRCLASGGAFSMEAVPHHAAAPPPPIPTITHRHWRWVMAEANCFFYPNAFLQRFLPSFRQLCLALRLLPRRLQALLTPRMQQARAVSPV